MGYKMYQGYKVSTHSRLKAAGFAQRGGVVGTQCFNTQPPEGGWVRPNKAIDVQDVSTHSRLKAAGLRLLRQQSKVYMFQHTAA